MEKLFKKIWRKKRSLIEETRDTSWSVARGRVVVLVRVRVQQGVLVRRLLVRVRSWSSVRCLKMGHWRWEEKYESLNSNSVHVMLQTHSSHSTFIFKASLLTANETSDGRGTWSIGIFTTQPIISHSGDRRPDLKSFSDWIDTWEQLFQT